MAHASSRLQLSLVLGCPGVDLDALDRWAGGPGADGPAKGLDTELAAVAHEIERASAEGELERASQRWRRLETRVRRATKGRGAPDPRSQLYPVSEELIPVELAGRDALQFEEQTADLDDLPMAYDARWGRLAWREHPGGVEFLSLEEAGGTGPAREVLPWPGRSPGLEGPAKLRLRGYLGYLLARDQTLGRAYEALLAPQRSFGSMFEVLCGELRATAAHVLGLAVLRRALTSGRRGPLECGDIDLGIRATDMDLLDRPTAGFRL